MKKFFAMALSCALCLSMLAGCGDSAASSAAPAASAAETATAAPTEAAAPAAVEASAKEEAPAEAGSAAEAAATDFTTVEDGKLRPPFNAIAGLGDNAALLIEKGAEGGRFISREEFVKRTRANSAVMEKLDALGCLNDLPDSDQVSMF